MNSPDGNSLAEELTRDFAIARTLRDGYVSSSSASQYGGEVSWRPGRDAPEIYLSLDLSQDLSTVVARVLDPEAGGLTGDLLTFERRDLGPGMRQYRYRVRLPWPFAPRVFACETRFAHDRDGVFWVRTREVDSPPCERGDIVGRVIRSDYRLSPRPDAGSRFERIQSIALELPVSRIWNRALVRHQRYDARVLTSPFSSIREPLIETL